MRRILALLLVLVLCVAFSACNKESDSSPADGSITVSGDVYTFTAKVTDKNGEHILVEVTEDGGNATPKGTEISISLKPLADSAPKLKKGDLVKVECDGIFLETYPLMLSELYSVSKIN